MNDDKTILQELATHLKSAIRAQAPTSSRELEESIDVVVKKTMEGFIIEGSAIYYEKYIRSGRKPGAKGIPINDLIEWIRTGKKQIPGMKERQQAFMFQYSIKKKGIKANPFVIRALDEQSLVIEEKIEGAMGAYVDTYIDYMFNRFA